MTALPGAPESVNVSLERFFKLKTVKRTRTAAELLLEGKSCIFERVDLRNERPQLALINGERHLLKLPAGPYEDTTKEG